MSPWCVIANPAAGRAGRDSRTWHAIEQALRQAQVPFDVTWTQGPGDGARLAVAAWHGGRDRFLVAGGDGSLHDVVNGLLRARHAGGPGADYGRRPVPTLVPLPLGTGNDWSRSLGLPRDPAALAAIVQRNRVVMHDVGRIDFPRDADATPDPCWFINVAGAGLDARVIGQLPARTPSRLAYLLGALRELVRYRAPAFRLRLDRSPGPADGRTPGAGIAPGESFELAGRWLLTFVANGQYCGGGMRVAPTAQVDDGSFDIVTIEALGVLRALTKVARLYTGGLLNDPVVRMQRAARVRIDADPVAGIEADGQFVGHTPAVVTLERGALQTLVGDGHALAAEAGARGN